MTRFAACSRFAAAFVGAYLAYAAVTALHGWLRGLGDEINGGRSHSLVPASEALLGGVMAERLQHLFGDQNPFLVELSLQLWLSLFWLAPLIAVIVFFLGGPPAFYRLLAVHAVVIFAADIFALVLPVRPPWMDADVTRIIALQVGSIGGTDTNPYAALPSLHCAIPAAYATWCWRQRDPRLRAFAPALTTWAAGMIFAVIYTGEHYIFCAALGVLLAVEVNLLLERVHLGDVRPWSGRSAVRTSVPVPVPIVIAAADAA